MNGLLFFHLTFCTTCFVFANLFGKNFEVFLQIVKGIEMILQEAFLRFEISPYVSNVFPWLNKHSPE
jgi:hypothetical protein